MSESQQSRDLIAPESIVEAKAPELGLGTPVTKASPVPASTGAADEHLDKTLTRMHRQQFGYWWEGFRRGRHAGEAVRQMWINYPFGALLLDETWVWWSLQQVQHDGLWQAEQAGYPEGLVVASSPGRLAVLCWKASSTAPRLTCVSHLATPVDLPLCSPPQTASAEQFLSETGFTDHSRVMACAYVQHRPRHAAQMLISHAAYPSRSMASQAFDEIGPASGPPAWHTASVKFTSSPPNRPGSALGGIPHAQRARLDGCGPRQTT